MRILFPCAIIFLALNEVFAGPGAVREIGVYKGGIVVGGSFDSAGSVAANGVAVFTDSIWSSLGAGVRKKSGAFGEVHAIAVKGDSLLVGGQFDTAGTVAASNVALWDGSKWLSLGAGLGYYTSFGPTPTVATVAFDSNGRPVAGGGFNMSGPDTVYRIAVYENGKWKQLGNPLGSLQVTEYVNSIMIDGPDVYAAGSFLQTFGATITYSIVKLNGALWEALGGNGIRGQSLYLPGFVSKTAKGTNNSLYAVGLFDSANAVAVNNVASYDGNNWKDLGFGKHGTVNTVLVKDSILIVAGSFDSAGSVAASNAAVWNGTAWASFAQPIVGQIYEMASLNGNLYFGGSISKAGSDSVNGIVGWNGSTFFRLGKGVRTPVAVRPGKQKGIQKNAPNKHFLHGSLKVWHRGEVYHLNGKQLAVPDGS